MAKRAEQDPSRLDEEQVPSATISTTELAFRFRPYPVLQKRLLDVMTDEEWDEILEAALVFGTTPVDPEITQ
jgi:hypothetical protein